MGIINNAIGIKTARKLISQGKISKKPWSFTAEDGNKLLGADNDFSNYSKWFLAKDGDAEKNTKAFYKYPFGKNGAIYRRGVIAAKQRAAQQGQTNIEGLATKLLNLINKKLEIQAEERKKMQCFVSLISYRIQALTQSEMISLIPADVMRKIKTKDEHPLFQAYSIAHEGVSTPKLIGEEAQPITWTRRAIQSIKDIIVKGVRFFIGHNEDSSTKNRKAIGKVVASTQKEINGKLHHIVIAYHRPEHREIAKGFDVCSQEAEWSFFEKAGKLVADSIEKLTGIALGRSKTDTPAFAGAKKLGMVQAFENNQEEEKIMTVEEIKKGIKELGVSPEKLYSEDDLKSIKFVNEIMSQVQTLQSQVETLEGSNADLIRKNETATSKTRLEKIMTEKNLTDKQKQFISKRWSKIAEKFDDESITKDVELLQGEYKEYVGFFTPEETQTETESTETDTVDSADMSKAENNELLEDDVTFD